MREHFRRIRSIPPRTALDAVRKQEDRLPPKEPGQGNFEQNPGGFNVRDHVFRKPTKEDLTGSLIIPEAERITWKAEIVEDCNSNGDLGIILQFAGIELAGTSFLRGKRNYGPDSAVFYASVGYKKDPVFLILATYGDILESQVVATKIDTRPFFSEEKYLSQLTVTHDPTSMTVSEKNRLIVVSYNKL